MDPLHSFFPRRNVPGAMNFALLALALIVAAQFLLGVAILRGSTKGPPALVVGAIVSAMVWLGLAQRRKWAYLVTIILCPVNVLSTLGVHGGFFVSLILNALVFLPVVLSMSWFWRGEHAPALR